MSEQEIQANIGKEVYCIATEQVVLLRGYRGNGLAQISHAERFVKGKYPHITHDCLLCNLRPMSNQEVHNAKMSRRIYEKQNQV